MESTKTHRDADTLLTPSELAEMLGVTERALGQMRFYGKGPRFVKISHKAIRYRRLDVEEWLESRVRQQSSREAR